jgi:hypothetical protein
MGRGLRAIVPALLMVVTALAASGPARAEVTTICDPRTHVCITIVTKPPTPGQPGKPVPTPPPDDPCAGEVAGDPTTADDPAACAAWQHQEVCVHAEADALESFGVNSVDQLDPAQLAQLNQQLNADGCTTVATPGDEAQSALKKIVFPLPSGHRSPLETSLLHGMPYTWTQLWTYFWTDASTWKTLTATAATPDGTVWATVTATPVSLAFDPGDGSSPVVCDGPGRPWTDADGFAAPAGGACGYVYTKVSSQPLTATETETWQVTWVGSGGSSGTITPPMATTTSGQLNVMQIETVVR